ncbi:MAG: GDSL-type esterase/lipase family protein [Ruminococcus sp.]|nr:GDSL-type esterase/lipase family protein [Ruminococcus sp.]
MKKFVLNELNTKQIGRTFISGEVLKLIMSASGCEFRFTGRKLKIAIGCDEGCPHELLPRVAVLVDGKIVVKKVISSCRESFTVFRSSKIRTVSVRIIKLSEAAFAAANVFPVVTEYDEFIEPTCEKSLKIEFIGDSITCGYGVDDSNVDGIFSTCAENAMKSFAYLTAELLDADYSMFSASGYGVISGCTHDGMQNFPERIPPFYESLGFSKFAVDGYVLPQNILWDFSKFVPDAVVINLGTNDHTYCLDNPLHRQEFEDGYLDFLRTVRRCNPHVELFCMLGIMKTALFPQVQNACRRFAAETGDRKIHTLEFECQDGTLGFTMNWHPSEDTHRLAAERAAEFMREYL